MKYAQSDGQTITWYRQPVHIDGKDIYTTDPRPYGWKEYVDVEPPTQEGYHAVLDGYDVGEVISPRWRLEPNPEPQVTTEEALAELNRLGVDTSDD